MSDDGEGVTEDWLLSIGFRDVRSTSNWPIYESPKSTRAGPTTWIGHEPRLGCDGWYVNEGEQISPMETRGDVRRLAAALGITLNEGAKHEV